MLGELTKLAELRLDANDLTGSVPCEAFNRERANFYADCSEISCPCCNFCCTDGDPKCVCPFQDTEPILCLK